MAKLDEEKLNILYKIERMIENRKRFINRLNKDMGIEIKSMSKKELDKYIHESRLIGIRYN